MKLDLLERLRSRTSLHYKDLEQGDLDAIFDSLNAASPPLHREEIENRGITTDDMYSVLKELATAPLSPIKPTDRE